MRGNQPTSASSGTRGNFICYVREQSCFLQFDAVQPSSIKSLNLQSQDISVFASCKSLFIVIFLLINMFFTGLAQLA